ncbi:MAG TPA: hypothetical protein DCL41_06550 [Bdellovibrionales bacterium]|nr:hypothetical protein [Pseudobdellovibrionaceae bacterium]HAG91511.1 hypothetical protein [Bdellovibrionales bacterium]|tara:strand:+ start:509 stop:1300 length:792 start_codon:yes stop_codon:yes gene_type:complete
MTMLEALGLSARLCGILAVVQSLEFLALYKTYSDSGIWKWVDLKKELSSSSQILASVFGLFMRPRMFFIWNVIRIVAGVALFFKAHFALLLFLLVLHFVTLIRWRGTFNGGSDYMNVIVLGGCTLAFAFPENFYVVMGALSYISFQLSLSYFKAGYLKVLEPSWRSGTALTDFVNNPSYQQNRVSRFLAQAPGVMFVLTWMVLLFEVLFPLSVLSPSMSLGFIGFAGLFHLGNVYLFGLNRFFWSWLSAYPCFYFVSLYLHSL